MARLIRPLRRTLLSPPKTLLPQLQPVNHRPISVPNQLESNPLIITRTYIAEMRKSAFQNNILRLLRNEIQYVFDRALPKQYKGYSAHPLYDFLEARGIDDQMAAFLHKYMKNKDRTEYIRWMGTLKSYIVEK